MFKLNSTCVIDSFFFSYDFGGVLLSTKKDPAEELATPILAHKRALHVKETNW